MGALAGDRARLKFQLGPKKYARPTTGACRRVLRTIGNDDVARRQTPTRGKAGGGGRCRRARVRCVWWRHCQEHHDLDAEPANVIAYVALAGTGGSLGDGSRLVEVTVSPAPASVGTPITVGTYPDAVAVTPNGQLALVANYTSNTVTPISLPAGKVLPAIQAGSGPAGIAIAPDGDTAYVTDANTDTVTPIDLSTLKPSKPITVGEGPQGIVITPDGSKAFVADAGAIISGQVGTIGHTVTPIDLSSGKALAPITVGNAPIGIAITPDGSTVFVTNLNSESVTPINTASDTTAAAIATDGGPIAVVVADNSAWVVNTPASGVPGNNVQPISVATDTAGHAIALPRGAQSIAVAPDGLTAWVVCLNTDRLVPIDLATAKAGQAIVVHGGPFAVAIANQAKATTSTSSPTTSVAKSKKKKKTKVTTTTK